MRIEPERIAALGAQRQAADQGAAKAVQLEATAKQTRDLPDRNRGYPAPLSSHSVSGLTLRPVCHVPCSRLRYHSGHLRLLLLPL